MPTCNVLTEAKTQSMVVSTINKLYTYGCRLLTDPKLFWILASLVVVADAALTELIIQFVPYTQIDWDTYMVHIELYLKGETDYSKLTGPTGPLVYPAGHVHIHELLYKITDSGRNLKVAQHIFGLLYILSLLMSCAIYRQAASVPNWLILFLPLSKRLHSIFVLRLFNDCWAVAVNQLAILMLQAGLDDAGVLLYGAALSVKMSILLYLPGLLVILFKRKGLGSTLRYIFTIISIQMLLASKFLQQNAWAYLQSAFDFGRVFLYKWTVNWRFVDEEVFLSRQWALGLLVGHASTLVLFGLFKWCEADGGVARVLQRGILRPLSPASPIPVTADDVTTILFTSNLIGMLFARSLHYQFYSWYAHQVPYLVWKTKYPLLFRLALLITIEYAWNTYPSTIMSSSFLLLANALMVAGVYFA
ncbi:dolichyl-P-Man:Man(5)GlcNAc(2)-PP-dolichyl mannosyltransferase [Amanita rubescens]|nr:dolichyl-P-Man:Man(5)GlcNAc(2)-PP-dolichyl mannosyltransferase [Amanita rubescens]